MKTKIFAVTFVIAIALTGIIGFSTSVKAGNTKDTDYAFYNTNDGGYTEGRTKENSTKVYIHPTSGPALEYTVQGFGGVSWTDRSNSHIIYNGTQASFTNYVYENSEVYARLHFVRTQLAPVYTHGEWSPDSTRNYTVYN